MQIISHRGWWLKQEERNRREAFVRSFDRGLGTETDLRDFCSRIVISHDMPKGDELSFEELLRIMDGRNFPLALNIKADGLIFEVERLLRQYGHTNWFTFDMSLPDLVVQVETGAKVFTGWSDLLAAPVLLDSAAGVWLDTFYHAWWAPDTVDCLIGQGKAVCVVSEDLHRRPVEEQWSLLKLCRSLGSDKLLLCTDYPDRALSFFGVTG